MGLFNFGGPSEQDKAAIIKGLKLELKGYREAEEERNEDERDFRDDFYERQEATEKSHRKEIVRIREEADEKVAAEKKGRKVFEEDVREAADKRIETVEKAADKKIETAEKAADKKVEVAEKAARDAKAEAKAGEQKVEVAVAKAVLEVKSKHIDELSEAQIEAAENLARAEAAEELTASTQLQLKEITKLMTDFAGTNNGFAEMIAKKLPNIDFTKLSVNVDMPAPEVTVISAGGGKPQNDNKPKQ